MDIDLDELRLMALAQHIKEELDEELDRDEVDVDGHNVTVNPHKKKSGASPAKIQGRIDLLHKALKVVGVEVDSCAALSAMSYKSIDRLFDLHEETREMKKIGLHDLVNTFYFLTEHATDTEATQNYKLSLQEAFEGLPIVDRRESYWTDDGEYLVVTDDEADELWEQDLDSYLDECVMPEVEENMRRYFDREAWKSDARQDGRAHSLGRYDGNEYEIRLEELDPDHYETEFYIYRVN